MWYYKSEDVIIHYNRKFNLADTADIFAPTCSEPIKSLSSHLLITSRTKEKVTVDLKIYTNFIMNILWQRLDIK